MAKFSGKSNSPHKRWETGSRTVGVLGDVTTAEGAPAFTRDAKSELFQLAVVNMVGEDTFYESAKKRDDRYSALVHQVTQEDPEWMVSFIHWLRTSANMRSASTVAAAEMARAWQQHGNAILRRMATDPKTNPHGRDLTRDRGPAREAVFMSVARADEPSELLGYWLRKYGRTLPKALKRGLADAVVDCYDEFTALKYDTDSRGVRFGDVIEMVHPTPSDPKQGALFKYLIDRRHHREEVDLSKLDMIATNKRVREAISNDADMLLRPHTIQGSGMTWENVLSLAGNKVDKALLWDALIPTMGYMALLRNLRNFDEAGISDDRVVDVQVRLANPEQVARSRQFPFRFLSAIQTVSSVRWHDTLERALRHSVANLPALPGRTLVLVDTSASMSGGLSARGTISPMMAGALFGCALAVKGEAVDLHGFANGVFKHKVNKGASVLLEAQRFIRREGEVGHGTMIAESIKAAYAGHDRVIMVTDMQTFSRDHYMVGNVTDAVPATVPMYAFNLGGYQATPLDTRVRNRYELGGLNDQTFKLIPLLERGQDAGWPWEH